MKPCSPVVKNHPNLKEIVYAKDQPEYIPLPVIRSEDGMVTSRWHFTLLERFKILFFGDLYLSILTFNKPLQPIKLSLDFNPVKEMAIYELINKDYAIQGVKHARNAS